ncbi:MAG: nucleotidyltransferase domain-containing protein [Vampirovibrionales bacterium]|nr:nucleotidyltransferase domain-containing protein [Vampirovibrionales bacterium]
MNTNIQIPETWQVLLKKIHAESAPDFQVWVFGSRATGTARSSSDLDLYLRHPDEITPCSTLAEIRNALSESHLPIFVDVFDFVSLPAYMKEEVLKTAVCLFSEDV